MREFLKKTNISDNAINIYTKLLGGSALIFKEFCSLDKSISNDEYEKIIKELIDSNLLIKIDSKNPLFPSYYLAVYPFQLIIDNFTNIKTTIKSHENNFKDIIKNNIAKIFEENNPIKPESLIQKIEGIKNEIENEIKNSTQKTNDIFDSIQEISQILEILEMLRSILFGINDQLAELHQKTKVIAQEQFGNLIKILSTVRNNLKIKIQELDRYKNDKEILKVIEDTFSKEFQGMVEEFTVTVIALIDLEFQNKIDPIYNLVNQVLKEKIIDPIEAHIEKNLSHNNEIISLHSNLIINLQNKFNEISVLITSEKDNILNKIENLKSILNDNLNTLLSDSIKQLTELYNPLEELINKLVEVARSQEIEINNLWMINNTIKLNHEIEQIIGNGKEEIIIIAPSIQDILNIKKIEEFNKTIHIKICSSELHDNTLIEAISGLENVEYRTLKNDNIFALQIDEDYFNINILQKDSQDSLNDNIGIGTNLKLLINLFSPIIDNIWSVAKPPPEPEPEPEPEQMVDKDVELEQIELISKIEPKSGDKRGIILNDAFNELIGKLNKFQGYEFSTELQKISDIVLEKVGFCHTLHDISTWISVYKPKYSKLDLNDIKQIFNKIEDWKKKLFEI